MKETIVELLQQRMDKVTNEQFWAVATLTGMNAFVLTQHTTLIDLGPALVFVAVVTLATAYGTWFIIQRHFNYYRYRGHLVDLLRDEEGVPEFLQQPPERKSNVLSGVVFYSGWVLLLGLLSVVALLGTETSASGKVGLSTFLQADRNWLAVWGLGFDIVGAVFLGTDLIVSKKKAIDLERAWLYVKGNAEANLQLPPVADRIRQSRHAVIGISLLVLGFFLQILAAWPTKDAGA